MFRESMVGFSRETIGDMWYLEGSWEPVGSPTSNSFQVFLESADLERNLTAGTGKLVKWREVDSPEWCDGLALG